MIEPIESPDACRALLLDPSGAEGRRLRSTSAVSRITIPGEVICQVADETAAVMIIAGTRSLGKMKRTILGSVSDYLVNHATCPVMVIRDTAEVERKRRPSAPDGSKSKARHASGDSIGLITASLHHRFASGGKRHRRRPKIS